MPKHRKSLPNGRQQGGAFGARPRGRRFAPPPWGSCSLPFGKDFLCLGLISGANPEAFPPSFFWDCPPSLVFLKKSLRSGPKRPKGPLGPLKKSLRSGPKRPLGPLKKSLRSGIHAWNPPKLSATPFISCPEKQKMGGFAAHFEEFLGMK